jgi:hypothetical protein
MFGKSPILGHVILHTRRKMKSMVPGMQVPQYAKEEYKSRRVMELKTETVRKDTGDYWE